MRDLYTDRFKEQPDDEDEPHVGFQIPFGGDAKAVKKLMSKLKDAADELLPYLKKVGHGGIGIRNDNYVLSIDIYEEDDE